MPVSLLDWAALRNMSRRVARGLAVTVLLSINRAFLQLWVAENTCGPENDAYFSASRTKGELLGVSLIMATNSLEFGAIGVLGTDGIGVSNEAGWRLQTDQGGQRKGRSEPPCHSSEAMVT
jgi:hypothetical protein